MMSIGQTLSALLFATACAAPTVAQTPPPVESRGFIEVNGTGVVQVTPDRARINFAVETQGASASDASSDNAQLMDAVVKALRGMGIRALEVETFGYALRPDYSMRPAEPQGGRVISGYTAMNNIRVTLADIQAVGRVMDAAIEAGANRVSSLAFEATDTEAARHEALTSAVAEARGQARTMAAALDRELGEPMEVRGGANVPSPRVQGGPAMMAMERAVDTPIEAGDLSVTASVFIRFAIGGPTSPEGR